MIVLGGTSFAFTKSGGICVRIAVAEDFVNMEYSVIGARRAAVETRCGVSTAHKKVSVGMGAVALLFASITSTSIGASYAKQRSKTGRCDVLRIYVAHINVAHRS